MFEPIADKLLPDLTQREEVVLDASQQAVLALQFGESAVVVGAPGSGKTTTLVELVADRVAGGMPAGDLLQWIAEHAPDVAPEQAGVTD